MVAMVNIQHLYMIVKGKIGFAKLTRQFAFCLPTCSCRARGGAAFALLLQSNWHAICSTRFRLFFVSSKGHEVAPMYCYRDRYRSNSAFRENSVHAHVGIVESCVERFANMVLYFDKNIALFVQWEPYLSLRAGKYMRALENCSESLSA
jgi:hypothetical protein